MPGACTGLVLPASARPPRPGDQGLIVPSAWVTFVQRPSGTPLIPLTQSRWGKQVVYHSRAVRALYKAWWAIGGSEFSAAWNREQGPSLLSLAAQANLSLRVPVLSLRWSFSCPKADGSPGAFPGPSHQKI